jgi:2-polyprenyl-3-methyl-5-hydroxy-6-metoxy-1,4-benzoquinol methylase
MIGTLLKELFRALRRYVVFHAKRAFGRHSQPSGEPMADVPPIYKPKASFDWQILSETNGTIYSGGPSLSTLDLLVEEPKFILDVGCSSGDFASNVKQRFPQSRVWGVEPNEAAARLAARRIDRVLCQMIEKIDWQREGVRRGDIDTVFLFDVLEHTYDPWKTMLTLRNLVSERAQLIVSLPNVRNALLIQDLISGYWRYRRAGLLDITHIRFFTYNDMCRMFYQTGFRVVATASTHCPQSAAILRKHKDGKFPQTVELESASITVHSAEDLASLCTVQHVFTLKPANYDQLSPGEREWIDAPHPPTLAFSPD